MKKLYLATIYSLVLFVSVFLGGHVFAADDSYGLEATAGAAHLTKYNFTVPVLIGNIIGTALSLVSVIFFILAVYGGFRMMIARGHEDEFEKGRDVLIQASIGLIIILASYAITRFVFQSVSPSNTSSSIGGGTTVLPATNASTNGTPSSPPFAGAADTSVSGMYCCLTHGNICIMIDAQSAKTADELASKLTSNNCDNVEKVASCTGVTSFTCPPTSDNNNVGNDSGSCVPIGIEMCPKINLGMDANNNGVVEQSEIANVPEETLDKVKESCNNAKSLGCIWGSIEKACSYDTNTTVNCGAPVNGFCNGDCKWVDV